MVNNIKKLRVAPLVARRNTCGPTSLRMVLAYYGIDKNERSILKEIGGLRKFGVRTIKLAKYAEKIGFGYTCLSYEKSLSRGIAKIKRPSTQDILKFLDKKVPVIIAVNSYLLFGDENKRMGHFIVIIGHKNGYFWYNDPWDGKTHKIAEENLKFVWFNNVIDSSAYFLAIWPKNPCRYMAKYKQRHGE